MNAPRLWLALAIVALAAMLWSMQRGEREGFVPAKETTTLPRYHADTATLSRFDETGALTLQGTAHNLEYFDDESGTAHQLDATVYDGESGARQDVWRVTAPLATLPAKTRQLLLQGGVVAEGQWPDSRQPLAVRMPSLLVNPVVHALSTDDAVTVVSDGRNGSGEGLRADWKARRIELLHNVKMRYDQKR